MIIDDCYIIFDKDKMPKVPEGGAMLMGPMGAIVLLHPDEEMQLFETIEESDDYVKKVTMEAIDRGEGKIDINLHPMNIVHYTI